MAVDKRQHPRVEIAWSATIVTPDGLVSCKTENLSAEGTLIRCSALPDELHNFRLVFKPSERQLILATAERVWSKTVDTDHNTPYVMGVRFTFVPEHDYQQISAAISNGTYGQKTPISAAL
ncbi:MAG: PilZ domain-containing protein [Deltaproteobacteria bacterium]|nr:PilZ domain-containing protein [Deltaproteobacteria bacterium]